MAKGLLEDAWRRHVWNEDFPMIIVVNVCVLLLLLVDWTGQDRIGEDDEVGIGIRQ